jgi:hypothetical protein
VVRQLWPFLDGAVPDWDRERIVAHLEECTACKSHFDFAAAFLDAVETAGHDAPELNPLRVRVLGALATEGFKLPGSGD